MKPKTLTGLNTSNQNIKTPVDYSRTRWTVLISVFTTGAYYLQRGLK